MSDRNWDNSTDRIKPLDDISARPVEDTETPTQVEIGLFAEGEYCESVTISPRRASELIEELRQALREIRPHVETRHRS